MRIDLGRGLSSHPRSFLFVTNVAVGYWLCVFATFRDALQFARAIFLNLLNQKPGAAFGTLARHRLVPHREFTDRVSRAAVKHSALASPLRYFAFPAFGATHASGLLFDVFAFRIIRARGERPVAALLDHKIAAALRTEIFE